MPNTLFVAHWEPGGAELLAEPLRAAGWHVETASGPDGFDCDAIMNCIPVAVVVSLDGAPEQACDLACELSKRGAAADTPIIIVGGVDGSRDIARARVPQALFVNADEVPWVAKRLVVKH